MAGKISGAGWSTFDVTPQGGGAAVDLRGDCTNLEISTPRNVSEVTGLDKLAVERILLLADASVTTDGVVNPDPGASFQTLKNVNSDTDPRTVTNAIAGQTLAMTLWGTDFKLTRGQDASFEWQVPWVLADGTVPTWT